MATTTAAEVVIEDFKRDGKGRRITPRAKREEMVEAYRASGLTMVQFAKREGINWLTLAKWSSRAGAVRAPVKFAEVKLGLPAAAWPYEVTLPNGITVRAASAPALVAMLEMIRK
jgi:transposase-like protein